MIRRGPCVPSSGTWRRKERERLAARLRDQSALCSEVMRRCCGGGGAGLGRVLGEGVKAAARGGVLCGRRGRRARAPSWRETAAGRTPSDLSAGPESRRLPPGPESKCYIKYWAVRTRGRAIARPCSPWPSLGSGHDSRPTARGAGAVCLGGGRGRKGGLQPTRCTTAR